MSVHALALELGMTVERLYAEMSVEEFVSWLRFYQQKDEPPKPDDLPELTPEAFMAQFK